MNLDIKSDFAAVVTGIRLEGEISAEELHEILRIWWRYPVLVFPKQEFDDERQIAFSRLLGDLERVKEGEYITRFSTVGPDGRAVPPSADQAQRLKVNEGWHADNSHPRVVASASLLSVCLAAPIGGDTEWADMQAAYDALDQDFQRDIEDLIAVHELVQPDTPYISEDEHRSEDMRRMFPPVAHRLVRRHPVTGRKSLYLGYKLSYILGHDPVISRKWAKALSEWSCQEARVFRYHLETGDAVLWDNLSVLHRARPYPGHIPRSVQRTTVVAEQSNDPLIDPIPDYESAVAAHDRVISGGTRLQEVPLPSITPLLTPS
jgi:alpha-ketoglutarate-dependent 2,4-dichlorophenoxyacetate dioxygenase